MWQSVRGLESDVCGVFVQGGDVAKGGWWQGKRSFLQPTPGTPATRPLSRPLPVSHPTTPSPPLTSPSATLDLPPSLSRACCPFPVSPPLPFYPSRPQPPSPLQPPSHLPQCHPGPAPQSVAGLLPLGKGRLRRLAPLCIQVQLIQVPAGG